MTLKLDQAIRHWVQEKRSKGGTVKIAAYPAPYSSDTARRIGEEVAALHEQRDNLSNNAWDWLYLLAEDVLHGEHSHVSDSAQLFMANARDNSRQGVAIVAIETSKALRLADALACHVYANLHFVWRRQDSYSVFEADTTKIQSDELTWDHDEEELLVKTSKETSKLIIKLRLSLGLSEKYRSHLNYLLVDDSAGFLWKFSDLIARRVLHNDPQVEWLQHCFGYESLDESIPLILPLNEQGKVVSFLHCRNQKECGKRYQPWVNFLFHENIPAHIKPPSIHKWLMACGTISDLDEGVLHSFTLYLPTDLNVKRRVKSFNSASVTHRYFCLTNSNYCTQHLPTDDGKSWGLKVWQHLLRVTDTLLKLQGKELLRCDEPILKEFVNISKNIDKLNLTDDRLLEYQSEELRNTAIKLLLYSAFLVGTLQPKVDKPHWIQSLSEYLKENGLQDVALLLDTAWNESVIQSKSHSPPHALTWESPSKLLSLHDKQLGSSLSLSNVLIPPKHSASFGIEQLYSAIRFAELIARQRQAGLNDAMTAFDHEIMQVASVVLPAKDGAQESTGLLRELDELFEVVSDYQVATSQGSGRQFLTIKVKDQWDAVRHLYIHLMPTVADWTRDLLLTWGSGRRNNEINRPENVKVLLSRAIAAGVRGGTIRRRIRKIGNHINPIYYRNQENNLKSMAEDFENLLLERVDWELVEHWSCVKSDSTILTQVMIAAVSNAVRHLDMRQDTSNNHCSLLSMEITPIYINSPEKLVLSIRNDTSGAFTEQGSTLDILRNLIPSIGGNPKNVFFDKDPNSSGQWLTQFDFDLNRIGMKIE